MKNVFGTMWLVAVASCMAVGADYDAQAMPAAEMMFDSPATALPASAERRELQDDSFKSEAGIARQVIYVAGLRLAVVKIAEAQNAVQSFAQQAGGYVQESETRSITIRVPVAQFDAVLARIAGLGEVIERSIRSSDVTEQMYDIELRLANLRSARERLLAHLEKSEKLEDTLRIEAELTRVTGEIESLEGKLRFMKAQVAMSTVHVSFDANTPQNSDATASLGLPFRWIARLGDGLVAGAVESRPRKPGFLASGPDFTPPPEFIRYYSESDLVEALSADGVRIKVQRHDNYDEGALEFWSVLARRALVAGRSLAVTREERLDPTRHLITGVREVAGRPHRYLLLLLKSDSGFFQDELFTFEAWGPEEEFRAREAALLESARSMER